MRSLDRNKGVKMIGLILLILICLSLPAYFIYQSARGLIISELNKNAINIAATAASFIEQDIGKYKGIPTDTSNNSEDFDKAYYQRLIDRFNQVKKESGAANIYTEKRATEEGKVYIIDGSAPPPPPEGPPKGISKSMTEEELKAFNGMITKSGLMWDKARGEYISGYAPIIDDKTSEPVGIVGVEFTLKYAQNITNGMRNIVFFCFFVILLLTLFVVNSLLASRRKYFEEDYLTGLFNKRLFERDLKRALQYIRKSGGKLSLIMIDVDSFKSINDTMGHTAGDLVLKSVAEKIEMHTRSKDLCCRYGGDEFIITLFNTDKVRAFAIAERMRNEIMNMKLNTDTGESIHVTLSIGVAEHSDGQRAESLIDCADKAMYASKNNGKNRTTVYEHDQVE